MFKALTACLFPQYAGGHDSGAQTLANHSRLTRKHCPILTTGTCSVAYKDEFVFEITQLHELPVGLWYTPTRTTFVGDDRGNSHMRLPTTMTRICHGHNWMKCKNTCKYTSKHRRIGASPNSNVLTLNVRGPSYLGLTRSISWLLMPWLLTSPGHQQPW